MIQVRQAERGIPEAAIAFAAAMAAVVVLSAVVVLGSFQLFGPSGPRLPGDASAAVLQSEASWTTQRLAEMGYIDPATRSAREWERQRNQQSHAFR